MKVAFGWGRLEKVKDLFGMFKYLLKSGSLITISAGRNSTDVKSHRMFRGSKMPVANPQQLRIISPGLTQRQQGEYPPQLTGCRFFKSIFKENDIVAVLKKNKRWSNVVKAHNR